VNVTLTRSGRLLFSKSPEVIAGISDRVVAGIRERITRAAEQLQSGSVPVPELGLTAMWRAGMGISMPGCASPMSPPGLRRGGVDHHWNMVALQVQDTIKKKGGKPYSLPSIAVVDVSRLGETSRLLSPEGISKYQDVIDNCDLGSLRGVLLVRTTLTSRVMNRCAGGLTSRFAWPQGPCSSVSMENRLSSPRTTLPGPAPLLIEHRSPGPGWKAADDDLANGRAGLGSGLLLARSVRTAGGSAGRTAARFSARAACLSQAAQRVGKYLALERPEARPRVPEVAKAGERIVETLGLP
jgi:hypothetical protein